MTPWPPCELGSPKEQTVTDDVRVAIGDVFAPQLMVVDYIESIGLGADSKATSLGFAPQGSIG